MCENPEMSGTRDRDGSGSRKFRDSRECPGFSRESGLPKIRRTRLMNMTSHIQRIVRKSVETLLIFRSTKISPALLSMSYLAFFHFSRNIEVFEFPHVVCYLLRKIRKPYVLRRDLETVRYINFFYKNGRKKTLKLQFSRMFRNTR